MTTTRYQIAATINRATMMLAVRKEFPAKTAREFLAYVKANPGKLNIGGASPTQQVAVEFFNVLAKRNRRKASK